MSDDVEEKLQRQRIKALTMFWYLISAERRDPFELLREVTRAASADPLFMQFPRAPARTQSGRSTRASAFDDGEAV